jgi:hypothetical protein
MTSRTGPSDEPDELVIRRAHRAEVISRPRARTRPPHDVHVAKWDCRDIVMVAGRDPCAWRGTADISQPYIRPDKDGGCHR